MSLTSEEMRVAARRAWNYPKGQGCNYIAGIPTRFPADALQEIRLDPALLTKG